MAEIGSYNAITLDGLVSVLNNRARSKKALGDTAKGTKIAVLVGAGASRSAGIPLADEVVAEVRKRFPQVVSAVQLDYAHCMARLAPADRVNLLREYIERAKVNAAHLYLAHLVKQGRVDRILTTNFDSLAVQALVLAHESPAVYDLANMRVFRPGQISAPAVIHLHGQLGGFVQLSTDQEFAELGNLVADVLRDTLADRSLIVVGYGGRNDPVFQRLCEYGRQYGGFPNGLYWISYGNAEPPDHVRDQLLRHAATTAFFLRNCDADSFFMALAGRLDEGLPKIVERPFTYLLEAIERIGELNAEQGGDDRISATRRQVGYAIDCHERGRMCARGKAEWVERLRTSIARRAQDILNYGQINETALNDVWEEAAACGVSEATELLAQALVADGARLAREAAELPDGDERAARAAEAVARCERALEGRPDLREAHAVCADAKLLLARQAVGEKHDQLFREVFGHCEAAVAHIDDGYEGMRMSDDGVSDVTISPSLPPHAASTYGRWAEALGEYAEGKSGEEKERLLAAAAAKRGYAGQKPQH